MIKSRDPETILAEIQRLEATNKKLANDLHVYTTYDRSRGHKTQEDFRSRQTRLSIENNIQLIASYEKLLIRLKSSRPERTYSNMSTSSLLSWTSKHSAATDIGPIANYLRPTAAASNRRVQKKPVNSSTAWKWSNFFQKAPLEANEDISNNRRRSISNATNPITNYPAVRRYSAQTGNEDSPSRRPSAAQAPDTMRKSSVRSDTTGSTRDSYSTLPGEATEGNVFAALAQRPRLY